MTDIRLLEAHEVPLLLPLARAFMAEGMISGRLNEPHFVKVLQQHIVNQTAFVLASGMPVRGMVSGVFFNDMATADLCCMEYFWYVAQEERGTLGSALLEQFEKYARSRKAVRIHMAHFVAGGGERLARYYERRGYRLKEQVFEKAWED